MLRPLGRGTIDRVDTPKINHLSLCSGYGGLDLGLRGVLDTCRTVAYVESEAWACANLVAKMEENALDSAPLWTDLTTFNGKEFCGSVDILSAGFPCQPFSTAGRRATDSDNRYLLPHVLRCVQQVNPYWVLFENVDGIIFTKTSNGVPVLLHVLSHLERQGYRAAWGIFSAAEIGSPQRRKRTFVLAHTRNTYCPELLSADRWAEKIAEIKELGQHGNQWPAGRGEQQKTWERPRTEVKRRVGRAAYGGAYRMDKRLDRLRMLGNGAVPAVVEKAFLHLYGELAAFV